MKNNKGFTLVELLAIVVILAIMMILAAPSVKKEIKKSEDENQNVLNQKIDNAAHLYAAKYYADKIVNNETFEFTLSDLEKDGLLDLKDKCSEELNKNISYCPSCDEKYDYINIKGCYNK